MRLTSFAALALVVGATAVLSAPAAGQAPTECQEATVVAPVVADAWVDLNSPVANKGTDAVLDVSGDARALVRFQLPASVPDGCVVQSARLRLYADSGAEGFKVDAVRAATPWVETAVNWENQPGTTGSVITAWSIDGYMTWNVTAHVREMIGGVNNGWLVRDAMDGTDLAGGHGFYAREKGEFPPQVVINFAAPPTGEPQPPEPPVDAAVTCGQMVTRSIRLTNDLTDCLGDGLLIGAPRIIVDLNGHTIDGIGLGHGIRNEGYGGVVVRDGTVMEFDHGVQLLAETADNLVEDLFLHSNEVSGIMLFDARAGNVVRSNRLEDNGGGLLLLSGTTGAQIEGNTLTLNSGGALVLRDSNVNRLVDNQIVGGGDLGIGLERSNDNVLLDNVVDGTSDGGIMVQLTSHRNRVEGNQVSNAGDTGILIKESDGNEVVRNSTHGMSDAGITLQTANDGVVADNDLGANPGGLQVDGSSRNLVSGNVAIGGGGNGIELGGGSFGNTLVGNTANLNGSTGIYISDEALIDPLGLDPSNVISHNTANGNGSDGIALAKGGHVVVGNEARDNRSYGINAGLGTIDGGRNAASGNSQAAQCSGVFCKAEWNPPETEIEDHPPEFTRSPSATFTFEGEDDSPGALRFECRLYRDVPSAFAACTSPQTFTGLSTGTYTFEVRAIDVANNVDESPASFTWTIDATPPETSIDSGPPALTSSTSASFEFSANEEGSTFECSLDGALYEACTSPASYAGLADGSHTLEVRATDRAGNTDASPASQTWTVDTVAPETAIDNAPDALTNSTSASFEFSATEEGSTFECSLDGADFESCTSPASYTDLADGEHTLRVRATDRAGNTDASPASHSWTVDTVAPETAIDDGPAALTNSASARFEFSATEEGSTFECSLDGADFAACTSPATYADLDDSEHVLRVRATDRAGNTDGSPASFTWTVDTTPPGTGFDRVPPPLTNSTTAIFEFSATEEGSTFECALDDGDFVACTSPHTYTNVADGLHTARVRATDRAGNTDPIPAARSWTVDTVAPQTSIDTGPLPLTNSTSATFTFSANEEGSSFECSLDDADFAPCSSPASYSNLSEGEHTLRVRATDAAHNTDASPASRTWTIDVTAPQTRIDGSPANLTNSNSASFEFSSNEAGSTFECSLDGAGFTDCGSPRAYSGLTDGEHTFRVRATDRAGNTDGSPASFTWTVDTVAPNTTIDSGPLAVTNSTSATFTFSANETGSTFQCALDDGDYEPCTSPTTYSNLADGEHFVRVRATDRAGNTDASPANRKWTVDTVAPNTTIDNGPPALTNSNTAIFEFSSNEAGSTFACSLDSGAYEPCSSPRTYSNLSDGEHTVRVRATDAAGNTDGSPASRSWTVDTVAPNTTIDDGPPAVTNSTSATFAFSSNEPGSTFECSLDDAAYQSCTSPRSYSDLADGEHDLRVRATDAAGNTDGSPASRSWTVDTVAPNTTIDDGPPALTNSASATFAFSSSETGSSFECALDEGDYQPCTSPRTYTNLSDGEHTVRVRATDAAGNTDGSPASRTWTVDTIAPDTTIEDGPAALSNSASATFTFSSNDAGATFGCSIDNAAYQPCTSPRTYANLADGEHNVRVRAVDPAGNVDASPASRTWTIDTVAPNTTIDDGPPALTNNTSATFAFSSNDPGSTFQCSLDEAGYQPCTSPRTYSNLGDGEHTLRVRATDAAGNTDGSPASRSWTIDTAAVNTSIDSGPLALTNSTSAMFTFSANKTGATFECSLDNAAYQPCTSPHTYTNLSDGEHNVRVRASDAAGNSDDTPASRSWTVDTIAPDTSIDDGPSGLTNRTFATFTFSANEAGATFECSLDDAAYAPCTSPRTYTDLAEGEHNLRVRATDPAGNTDAPPATRAWSIDTIAPHTAIDTGPDAQTPDTSATFRFSSNETGSSFECSLDSSDYEPCTSPTTYSGLAVGSHEFRVRATDPAGNTDASPAVRTWEVRAPDVPDTTPPNTSIGDRPADPTNSRSASFTFTGTDDRTAPAELSFECSLDGATFASCASPQAYSALADGSHTFRVRATDGAGNVDDSPAAYTWRIDATAPQTTIDDAPQSNTSSTSATFAFSSSETGSTFECSLDSAAYQPCASPQQYSGLSTGSHTFRVRATDAVGNTDDTPATHTWTINAGDTTPPQTTIDTGPLPQSNSRSATFTFSSNETGSTFECSLDNAAFSACTTPHEYSDLADGSHTFRVRATDAAGNVDDSPASRTWSIDATAPNTTIGNAPLANTTSTSASFTFSSEAGATFECSLDSGAFVACTSPRNHTNLSAGTHTFRVRARDAIGNVDDTPATHTWTIDNTAPNTTINGGPPARINVTTATFTFSANESATFECSLDNAAFTACTSPRTYTNLSVATHNFRVRARDLAGNLDSTPAAQSWVIDTTAPNTTISNPPPAQSTSPNASFQFSSEAGATFECSLDNAVFTACTSPQAYSGLAAGTHNFRVRARDVAGNVDASPASHNWTITLPGPCAQVTAAANADAWIDQNSPTSNKGTDSTLKVQSKSGTNNFRALVRFTMPASVPQGCVFSSATLRVFAASARTGRTLHALRLASTWTETAVNWSNQPLTTGAAAAVASGTGYREWDVTSHVQAIFQGAANNGFLIRDSVEGADAEQQFNSREKGENLPQLVIRYTAAG
jgi:large repetitive protein